MLSKPLSCPSFLCPSLEKGMAGQSVAGNTSTQVRGIFWQVIGTRYICLGCIVVLIRNRYILPGVGVRVVSLIADNLLINGLMAVCPTVKVRRHLPLRGWRILLTFEDKPTGSGASTAVTEAAPCTISWTTAPSKISTLWCMGLESECEKTISNLCSFVELVPATVEVPNAVKDGEVKPWWWAFLLWVIPWEC